MAAKGRTDRIRLFQKIWDVSCLSDWKNIQNKTHAKYSLNVYFAKKHLYNLFLNQIIGQKRNYPWWFYLVSLNAGTICGTPVIYHPPCWPPPCPPWTWTRKTCSPPPWWAWGCGWKLNRKILSVIRRSLKTRLSTHSWGLFSDNTDDLWWWSWSWWWSDSW